MNRPATAASTPASTQAIADTVTRRTPISAAVSGSSATARMATPHLEYRSHTKKAAMRAAPTSSAAILVCGMATRRAGPPVLPRIATGTYRRGRSAG